MVDYRALVGGKHLQSELFQEWFSFCPLNERFKQSLFLLLTNFSP